MESLRPVDTSKSSGLPPRSWNGPIHRVKLTEDPKKEVQDQQYDGHHLYEVMGFKLVFRNCDFTGAVIERSYFRGAKFIDCKFVGTKFIDSNFRSAEFSACKFDHASVLRTNLPISELLHNLPSFPNVRRELLQQLRANATALGDPTHINALVARELQAERDHWREARKRTSAYYEQKYSSPTDVLKTHWHSFRLWLDLVVWGHGESITRLIVSTACGIALMAIVDWIAMSTKGPQELTLGELWASFTLAWSLYIDLPSVQAETLHERHIWASTVVLLRYLSLGLFISVVFRKLSKR